MAFSMPIKQTGVKNIGFRVELMEWSNKMDLIAIANEKGEIIIQRLNWQKVIVFPPVADGVKVKALAWQPDEAVVAAGYSNGKVSLLDIEKEDEVYSFNCESDIKTMNWTKTNILDNVDLRKSENSSPNDDDYLTPLINLNSLSSTSRKSELCSARSFAKGSPKFLVICLASGQIRISVFGLLPCGSINISDYVSDSANYEIHDVRLSANFNEIYVFLTNKGVLELLIYENSVLTKYAQSLFNLAIKHGSVLDTMNYINETIQCIIESWETVLLEMDNKLTKYANSQPEGSISADFLELLMFGYPSEALEQFLVRDLTEKGLKKLANSIELSYSTIQKLVITPLHNASTNLIYYLNSIKGLSRNSYSYSVLLDTKSAENASSSAGSFMVKVFELQQTLSQSVTDYKTFWCWLYMVIMRLMDENVPDEVSSVSQQDITYLAEFLNSFDDCVFEKEDGSVGKRKFNLERVGQYLENCDLQTPVKQPVWNNVLSENECLRESALIFPHHTNYSLIQEFNLVKQNISILFDRPNAKVGESFQLKSRILCTNREPVGGETIRTTFISNEIVPSDMLIATTGANELIYVQIASPTALKASKLTMARSAFTDAQFRSLGDVIVRDLQFYNAGSLSLLLRGLADGRNVNYFIQLGMAEWEAACSCHQMGSELDLRQTAAANSFFDFIDIGSFSKPIDGNTCVMIAVSGKRKVASILSDNCRKIRLYEMEVDDDDDEMEASMSMFNTREIL